LLTLTTLAARDTVAASSYTTVMDHAAQAFEVPGTPILAVGVMRSFVLAVLAWRSRTGQRACGVPRQAFGGTSASRGARNAAGRSGCPPSQCLPFSDRAQVLRPLAEALPGAWTPQRSGLRAANRAPLWRGSAPAGWIGHCPARRGDDCLSSHQEDGTRPAVRVEWCLAARAEGYGPDSEIPGDSAKAGGDRRRLPSKTRPDSGLAWTRHRPWIPRPGHCCKWPCRWPSGHRRCTWNGAPAGRWLRARPRTRSRTCCWRSPGAGLGRGACAARRYGKRGMTSRPRWRNRPINR